VGEEATAAERDEGLKRTRPSAFLGCIVSPLQYCLSSAQLILEHMLHSKVPQPESAHIVAVPVA